MNTPSTNKKKFNKINPKVLLNSKWTKCLVQNKEKHFTVVKVTFDEEQRVVDCVIEAVMSKNQYTINWRELKDSEHWLTGWK